MSHLVILTVIYVTGLFFFLSLLINGFRYIECAYMQTSGMNRTLPRPYWERYCVDTDIYWLKWDMYNSYTRGKILVVLG